jgi:DNA-binding transcriptional LysR family regulator
VTSNRHFAHEQDPIPLAVYNEECVFRKWAMNALAKINKDSRIAFTSPSTSGILATVKNRLAVATIGYSALTNGIRIIDVNEGFPELPIAYVTRVTSSQNSSPAITSLYEHVANSFEEFNINNQIIKPSLCFHH